MARLLAPEDVLNATFTQTQFRLGYDEREVDELLDLVVATLRFHTGHGVATAAPLTAERVALTRFTQTQLRRGYDSSEIDAFLADVVHTLTEYESGRGVVVGSGRPTVPAPSPGRPSPTGPRTGETEPFGRRVLRFLRGDKG